MIFVAEKQIILSSLQYSIAILFDCNLQINDDGVISFGSRYNVYNPQSLPLNGTDKIIAPYWADVDTRGTGRVFYRQTINSSLLARATSEIRAAFPMFKSGNIQNLLIATWYRVGHFHYYNQRTDKVSVIVIPPVHYIHVTGFAQRGHPIPRGL